MPLTSFEGREAVVAAVWAQLRDPGVRLLTLTGPGGVGKTRLALEAARGAAGTGLGGGAGGGTSGPLNADGAPSGVRFVSLASLTDPALVGASVARAVGRRDDGARPLMDALEAALRESALLLVLDSCEHVLVGVGPLASRLLGAAPGLVVLATSRVPLAVSGEHVFPVPPLTLPPAGVPSAGPGAAPAALASGAVRLFAARARAVRPDFALTDGAAPARQQSLRATVTWSYGLLDGPLRALFRRLAVFAGGFSLEAAHAVAVAGSDASASDGRCPPPAGGPEGPAATLERLATLVDQSLIGQEEAAGEPRYSMLATVREFALECLEASGGAGAARRAHAAHFLAWVEAASDALRATREPAWLDRLEAERANLREALSWAAEHEPEWGLRLAGAASRFWEMQGHFSEARESLGLVLAAPRARMPAAPRSAALLHQGHFARMQGDYPAARAL